MTSFKGPPTSTEIPPELADWFTDFTDFGFRPRTGLGPGSGPGFGPGHEPVHGPGRRPEHELDHGP